MKSLNFEVKRIMYMSFALLSALCFLFKINIFISSLFFIGAICLINYKDHNIDSIPNEVNRSLGSMTMALMIISYFEFTSAIGDQLKINDGYLIFKVIQISVLLVILIYFIRLNYLKGLESKKMD